MKINDNYLDDAIQIESPNVTWDPPIKPKYIVVHGTRLWDVQTLLETFEEPTTKESTHLIIDGKDVYQLAPFNAKTWHAGVSYWQGYNGLNGFSIGIHVIDGPSGIKAGDSSITLHEVVPLLVEEYNIRDIIDHADTCDRPYHSPRYGVEGLKKYVDYGNADCVGRFIITLGTLVRGGPHVNFEELDKLASGDGVKVLRYSPDKQWACVLYTRKDDNQPKHGWVHESFLRRL